MFADVANEFENITKFELLDYFTRFRDFMQDDYNDVYNYFAGNSETIDSKKLKIMETLLSDSRNLMRTFQTFSGKLGNVGYWELQQYCQDLEDTLEKISKFPKYLRTAKTTRGYKPYIQVSENIGGMKTIQDLSNQLGDDISEQDIILNNDLEEEDYEIDKLSKVNALVNNNVSVIVTTILEQPIGRKIYGRDICCNISFSDNDLSLVEYEDNIEQKCDIIMSLNKGDIPEFPTLGHSLMVGKNQNNYNYSELISDLRDTFLQDDLFDSVNVTRIDREFSDYYIVCEIMTKYVYSTTKNIKI